MLVTSRCLAEYRAMFDLGAGDLGGVVVDCCAGASSFVAELDGRAYAVDPAYATARDRLVADVTASMDGATRISTRYADHFVWDWYGTPERRTELRERAARRFLADLERGPSRYLAAALPHLPFADRSVDLVLCSHLLFTWSNQLDADWHRAALRELVRISRGEVRVFPLVVQGTGAPVPFLDELRRSMRESGIETELRRVPYEFQRGADTMLVAHRTEPEPDLLSVLRRWELSGAVWRVLRRSATGTTVALYRCDDGEEVDRFSTEDPDVLAYLGDRSTNANPCA